MQLKFDWLIVLENLHHGIMVTDVNLEAPAGPRNIYVNRAWMKITGYDRTDIGGKTSHTAIMAKSLAFTLIEHWRV